MEKAWPIKVIQNDQRWRPLPKGIEECTRSSNLLHI